MHRTFQNLKKLSLQIIFCILVLALQSLFALAQEKQKYEWEKIILLETKETEVEKYFGKAFLENGYVKVYEKDFGKIIVFYRGVKNIKKPDCEWNIPLDTVYSYSVSLSEPIPLLNFNYNLRTFEKEEGHDGTLYYSNQKMQISASAYLAKDTEEFINRVSYAPTQADIKSKCIEPK